MYLLDTDVCIYLLRGRAPAVAERLRNLPLEEIGTTAITVAELRYGALRSTRPRENARRVDLFVAPLTVLPFDQEAGQHFARVKAQLAAAGQLIGPMDLLIAGIALANGAILVSNNSREFDRVQSLRVENWLVG